MHSIVFELAAEMSGSSRAGGYASRRLRANAPSPPSPAAGNQAAAGRGTRATQPLPPIPGPVVFWTCAAASNGPCPPAGVESAKKEAALSVGPELVSVMSNVEVTPALNPLFPLPKVNRMS